MRQAPEAISRCATRGVSPAAATSPISHENVAGHRDLARLIHAYDLVVEGAPWEECVLLARLALVDLALDRPDHALERAARIEAVAHGWEPSAKCWRHARFAPWRAGSWESPSRTPRSCGRWTRSSSTPKPGSRKRPMLSQCGRPSVWQGSRTIGRGWRRYSGGRARRTPRGRVPVIVTG